MKQIIIDTNVFLRYFLRDIDSQYRKAKKLISQIEDAEVIGKVSILVIDELVWAMGTYYKIERKMFLPEMKKVLSLKNIRIIESEKSIILRILDRMTISMTDFTDFYLFEIAEGGEIFTFDTDFKKIPQKPTAGQ